MNCLLSAEKINKSKRQIIEAKQIYAGKALSYTSGCKQKSISVSSMWCWTQGHDLVSHIAHRDLAAVSLTCICSWRTPCTSTCHPCTAPLHDPDPSSRGSQSHPGCLCRPAEEKRRRRCPRRRRTLAFWKEEKRQMGASMFKQSMFWRTNFRQITWHEKRLFFLFTFTSQKNGCHV